MSVPRAQAVVLLLLALHTFSTFAATLQSNSFDLSNTSHAVSSPLLNGSSNVESSDCFNPAIPRSGLYPADLRDCLNAARDLFNIRDPFRAVTFARRHNVGFKLPYVVRNETCVISIDVINDADTDIFMPYIVYSTAMELALRCTQGAFHFGGRTKTGPKQVVDVLVFGRIWPSENRAFEQAASESDIVVARERFISRDLNILDGPSPSLTGASLMNDTDQNSTLGVNIPKVSPALNCYDPPLPRERAWPINVKDCEVASQAIIGHRRSDKKYTFSRAWIASNSYYPLPVTNRYRSCVVHLDMNNDRDQDTVRLSIVEATAWVLAHKCSGEEKPVEKYGGWGKVTVGSKGLIRVWVYGRLWPPPASANNVTNLVLAQPLSSTDGDQE